MSYLIPDCRETYAIIVRLTFLFTWVVLFLSFLFVLAQSIYFRSKHKKVNTKFHLKKILITLAISAMVFLGFIIIEQISGEEKCFGITCAWNLTDKTCSPF